MRGFAYLASAVVAASVSLAGPAPLRAQSAAEVVSSYGRAHAERLESVDDVTIVQSVMGMPSELYMEKSEAGGNANLEARLMRMAGGMIPIQPGSSDGAFFGDPSALLLEHSESAELRGGDIIDGVETSALVIENLTELELNIPGLPAGEGMRVGSLRFFVDTEEWVIRRMEAYDTALVTAGGAGATLSVTFGDFRSTGEFVHPFRIVIAASGIGSGISAQDLEQVTRTLAEMEARLETMPPEQREAVEAMLAEQMQNLLGMAGPASITVEIVVEEVRVNEGAPGA